MVHVNMRKSDVSGAVVPSELKWEFGGKLERVHRMKIASMNWNQDKGLSGEEFKCCCFS